jgi:hypothetical protein
MVKSSTSEVHKMWWQGSLAMRQRPMSAVLRMVIISIIGVSVAATGAWGAAGGYA